MSDGFEMMVPAKPVSDIELVDLLVGSGIDTYCLVADSVFSSIDQYITDLRNDGQMNRWVVPSERSIPAVAAGRWLASGKLTVMLMQNSGFSNAMDYLSTVMLVHRIPGLVVSGWRGYDPARDLSEPHILIGDTTESISKTVLGEGHVFGHRDGSKLLEEARSAVRDALSGNLACLHVSPLSFVKTYPLQRVSQDLMPSMDMDYYHAMADKKGRSYTEVIREPLISREQALLRIHEEMREADPFYIIGNGYNPRAMQALRITENTFENSGGMGSSLAMAWGAAKSNPGQVFVAIDGDQNAMMNEMEKVLCSDYPENLYWYIINNGTGESVGTSLSLPLAPWHYDLARVINTRNEEPGSFSYPRIDASGMKFVTDEAKDLADRIGNLPAQARLARDILARKSELKKR